MKIALCFIISGEHILNKEEIWREWIEYNKDIINVYFFYSNINKIKSDWVMKHTIPFSYISNVSYFHIIPAYTSLMKFALIHDANNEWFCMLSESCCPIISPKKFRYLFYKNYNKSIMRCQSSWWNINFHKRSNLSKLPKELHLANDPWFVVKKENVIQILHFINKQPEATKTICDGGLANESLFAIILYGYKQLNLPQNACQVISDVTHIADWNRMSSTTSPHVFTEANKIDILFINAELTTNKHSMFIRKIGCDFPNETLRHYIYTFNKDNDDKLIIREPFFDMCNKLKKILFCTFSIMAFLLYIVFNTSIDYHIQYT